MAMMTIDKLPPVVVDFRIRTTVRDGDAQTVRYDWLSINSPRMDGHLVTLYPPVVGDLLRLYGSVTPADEGFPSKKGGGVYRVVGREWSHSSYGSANWHVLAAQPVHVDLLVVLEEAPESLFPGNEAATVAYPRWTESEWRRPSDG